MEYTNRDLQDENRFTLLRVLSLEDIVQFLFQQIRILNPLTVLFFIAILLSFSTIVLALVFEVLPGPWSWGKITLVGLLGFVCWPICLIPVHEVIHALVYKLTGAPKIKFGIKPAKCLFYVTADKYVIGKRHFILVALMPFLVISLLLIVLAHFIVTPLSWSFIVCLFVHTTMCIGDFALAGLFIQHKRQAIYTYDDVENSVTYFYKKRG